MCANSKKNLYGLKKSPRAWLDRFTHIMLKWGFKQNQRNHTLLIKYSSQGKIVALIVDVDDIIVTENDLKAIVQLKKSSSKEFEIKNLDALKYFLNFKVAKSKYGIFILHRKYVLVIL